MYKFCKLYLKGQYDTPSLKRARRISIGSDKGVHFSNAAWAGTLQNGPLVLGPLKLRDVGNWTWC